MNDAESGKDGKPRKSSTIGKSFDRFARKPYTQGLPEWNLFPNDEARESAIREIERGMTPRSIGAALWFILLVAALFLGPYLLIDFIVRSLWVNIPHQSFITLIAAGIIYTVLVFVLIRQSMPRELRKRLLRCGVPVCLKCGYALRGLPADRTRCPECGRTINQQARKLMQDSSPPAR